MASKKNRNQNNQRISNPAQKEVPVIDIGKSQEEFQQDIEKKSELDKLQEQLNLRERALIVREREAEEGFASQNQKYIEELNQIQQKLKEEAKQKTEDDCTKILQRATKESDERLQRTKSECAERLQRTESECAEQLQRVEEECAEKLRRVEEECAAHLQRTMEEVGSQQQYYADLKAELESRAEELEEKERTHQHKQRQLTFDKEQIEEDREVFKQKIIDMYKDKVQGLQDKIALYEKQNKNLLAKLAHYEQVEINTAGRDMHALMKEIDSLKAQLVAHEKEPRYTDSQIDEMERRLRDYDTLSTVHKKLEDDYRGLQNSCVSATKYAGLEADMEQQRAMNKVRLDEYESRLKFYKDQYEVKKSNLEERVMAIKQVYTNRTNTTLRPVEPTSESEWLNYIFQECNANHFKFNKRLLYSFHTALKTSDISALTILGGVSGTGKSKLPSLYTRYGGMAFLMLSVQPDWDGPGSLFGYFNSVDNQFNATELIRAMEQYSQGDSQDAMLLVLLDEMNLAHIELYFSEMLSKLESRSDGAAVSVSVDMGAGVPKHELPLTDNILWVGTMNQDETTKALSDKVIDRSNFITFPRPQSLRSRPVAKLTDPAQLIRRNTWQKWLSQSVVFTDKEMESYRNVVEKISEYLGQVNRALGHRVWQSVERYIAHHPLVIEASSKVDKEDEHMPKIKAVVDFAFEEAIVHKVMPKLRGIEVDGEAKDNCLDPIGNILLPYTIKEDFDRSMLNPNHIFDWNSSHYLEIPDSEYEVN